MGCKVYIWKQDPSVTNIGKRASFISSGVHPGPRDDDIAIEIKPSIHPNTMGDFLFDPEINPKEFDAVHTFTIIRQVLTMYERAFRRTKISREKKWYWGGLWIKVYPYAGIDTNAAYDRKNRALKFFYFFPNNDRNKQPIYTCRSFDIVSHETGHAILDSFKPKYLDSSDKETLAFHESFADLTAIMTILSQMDLCETIIAESKADLHNRSFFPILAEQFGVAMGRSYGLRNADQDLSMALVNKKDIYELSKVFTGAVYDILSDFFDDYQQPDKFDQAESLFRLGKRLTDLLIRSIDRSPDNKVKFSDIATQMYKIEDKKKFKKVIQKQFKRRGVNISPKK